MPVFLDTTCGRDITGEFTKVTIDAGWPDAHLTARPGDEIGQSIIDFAKLHRDHPKFPASPWDDRRGEIHLPNLDAPRAPTDEIPRYRLRETAVFNAVIYAAGAEVSSPSWPDKPGILEAVNESGKLVLSYMMRHAAGQKLSGLVLKDGQLFFPNPAARGSPISPTLRWAGAAR
jgi:hypothetical protein